jgi:glycosyltransferase involved in cell wall biosynthesis
MSDAPDLKVLVIVNRLFEWSQNFISRELCELRRQNVGIVVAARRTVVRADLTEEERQLAKQYIAIPENPVMPRCLWRHVLYAVRNYAPYWRACKHLLFSGHTHPMKMLRSGICLFRATTIARQVQGSAIDLIHAHFMTAPTETALYLSALTGIPFGCTSHAMDIYHDNSGQQKKIDHAAYLITETKANVKYFLDTWQIGENRLFQVYNSLPQKHLEGRKNRHEPLIFLAVGRLVAKKGLHYLIAACSKLRQDGLEFVCNIVGTGPLADALEAQVMAGGLQDIISFQGYVPPNRMDACYHEADILVVPSIIADNGDRDGLPTVCMEALYHGLPLICSDVSGLPECIIEGQNGFVVPAKNVEALAGAMARCLSADYPGMSRKAVQVARQLFDSRANGGRIKDIMLQAVDRT